jgi:hypothetical protein
MLKYTSGPARYAKNSIAVSAPSSDIRMSRAASLAQEVGGRYSNRERSFIMSKAQFKKYQNRVNSERQEIRDMWRRRNREGL